MRTFAQKQNQPPKPSLARSSVAKPGPNHRGHPILHLQRVIGNRAMQRMLQTHAEAPEARMTAAASSRFGYDFSQIPIHPPAAGAIRTKLAINKPGDKYEQEADRVAEQMMRMTDTPLVQRKCADCEEESERLQRKPLAESITPVIQAKGTEGAGGQLPGAVQSTLATSSHPLDAAVRSFMEPKFGYSFGGVRVHSDARAADSARQVGARAYTVGEHIVVGANRPSFDTDAGIHFWAHELAHVVQQRRGGHAPEVSPSAPHEREADAAATAIAMGRSSVQISSRTGLGIARQPDFHDDFKWELERLKREAQLLLDDEGITRPVARESVGKPKRVPSPRINDVVRELKRVANDPRANRAADAKRVLGDIAVVRRRLADTNRIRDAGRPPGSSNYKSPKSDPAADTTSKPAKVAPAAPAKSPAVTVKTPTVPAGPSPTGASRVTAEESVNSQLAKQIVSGQKSLEQAQNFNRRIRGYLTAWNALNDALSLLAAINSMTSLLAHGTAMPKEQQEADAVRRGSEEAITEAETATEDISVLFWTMSISNALRADDAEALFDIDITLMHTQFSLEASAKNLTIMSDDLAQRADGLKGVVWQQLVEVGVPHPESGTVDNTIAAELYLSLDKLHGTIRAASENYATAAQRLTDWAMRLKSLGDTAEDAGWFVARGRAFRRLRRSPMTVRSANLDEILESSKTTSRARTQ